jgi:hypothetical protein
LFSTGFVVCVKWCVADHVAAVNVSLPSACMQVGALVDGIA